MDAIEALNTRRSIRKYNEGKISEDTINKILEAGMEAPSAINEQPWHFIVITDKEILNKIPEIHPHALMARQATIGIIVCCDLSLEKSNGFWVQDCSAATQNILLAVHALGLGAVWTGVYPNKERVNGFKEFFNLADNIIPFAFIPVGLPAEESCKAERFKKERIHYNKW